MQNITKDQLVTIIELELENCKLEKGNLRWVAEHILSIVEDTGVVFNKEEKAE